jgi:hypothetical protein
MGGGLEVTTSDYSKSIIALACWRAAQTELHSAMLCVAMVFKNMADAGWYEGDVYTAVCHWLAENPGAFPDVRDPQFQQLVNKLDLVLTGMAADKTDGALWFGPKTLEKIEGTITTTVGNLIFVR